MALIYRNCPNLFLPKSNSFILYLTHRNFSLQLKEDHKKELIEISNTFINEQKANVSKTTLISGHDTTINTFLTFLMTDPDNINLSYKRLKNLMNYPPKFASNLTFVIINCSECESKLAVKIEYDFQAIQPYFCKNNGYCDLLVFLKYMKTRVNFEMSVQISSTLSPDDDI